MYFFIRSEFSDRVPQNVKFRLNLAEAQIRSGGNLFSTRRTLAFRQTPTLGPCYGEVSRVTDFAQVWRSPRKVDNASQHHHKRTSTKAISRGDEVSFAAPGWLPNAGVALALH